MGSNIHILDIPTATLIYLIKRRQIIIQMELSFEENVAKRFELEKNDTALNELLIIQFYQNFLQTTDVVGKSPPLEQF